MHNNKVSILPTSVLFIIVGRNWFYNRMYYGIGKCFCKVIGQTQISQK
jgi:hypothetical protein